MARKRKKLKTLEYNSREYWNRLLAEDGLSLDQGRDPRLLYGGSGTEIETLAGTAHVGGRKLPHKGLE
jgi:hypothetical protein